MSHEGLQKAIMNFMKNHRGRENAIPREVLEADLGPFVPYKDRDRAFRRAYAQLPICSCPEGLFLPHTAHEVREFREYMAKGPGGPIAAYKRVMVIYAARPELVPEYGVQQKLFDLEAKP